MRDHLPASGFIMGLRNTFLSGFIASPHSDLSYSFPSCSCSGKFHHKPLSLSASSLEVTQSKAV